MILDKPMRALLCFLIIKTQNHLKLELSKRRCLAAIVANNKVKPKQEQTSAHSPKELAVRLGWY